MASSPWGLVCTVFGTLPPRSSVHHHRRRGVLRHACERSSVCTVVAERRSGRIEPQAESLLSVTDGTMPADRKHQYPVIVGRGLPAQCSARSAPLMPNAVRRSAGGIRRRNRA